MDQLSAALESIPLEQWRSVCLSGLSQFGFEAECAGFYAVTSGKCLLRVNDDSEVLAMNSGDVVILPRRIRHTLPSSENQVLKPFPESQTTINLRVRRHSASELTTVAYGHYQMPAYNDNPLRCLLPEILKISRSDESAQDQRAISYLLYVMHEYSDSVAAGAQAVVNQMGRSLFLELIRQQIASQSDWTSVNNDHMTNDSGGETGSLVAFLDPFVGQALALVHSDPSHSWTVQSLANRTGMSRSAFAGRFREVVGKPPLQYIAELRIRKACCLLSGSNVGVQEIATRLGYDSPSAFSNAFKRHVGVSPAAWRRDNADTAESLERPDNLLTSP